MEMVTYFWNMLLELFHLDLQAQTLDESRFVCTEKLKNQQ